MKQGTKHTKETIEKIRKAKRLNPTRYWLGKKRPKMKDWIDLEHLKPYQFKKGQKQTNTGRTWFKKSRTRPKIEVERMQKTLKKMWAERHDEIVAKRNQGGKNHWNWQDGKSLEKYGKDWTKELKQKVRKRDEFKCQKCKRKKDLVVHHKDFNKKNNKINNLRVLCRSCHIKLHANERTNNKIKRC